MGKPHQNTQDLPHDGFLDAGQPLWWRQQHGPVERLTEQIADAAGDIGYPARAIGLMAAMERNGRISCEMSAAGDRFHELFVLAQLDPLRAADMTRCGGGGASSPHGTAGARSKVADALQALGGPASPAGCCAWFVLGCEHSLTQWAQREGWRGRPISTHVATGVLIASLGVLQIHFGY